MIIKYYSKPPLYVSPQSLAIGLSRERRKGRENRGKKEEGEEEEEEVEKRPVMAPLHAMKVT